VLSDPGRVQHRCVDVPTGPGIADPVEGITPFRMARQRLGSKRRERVEVDLAAVGGARLQRLVEIVAGHRAVVADHLVDDPLLAGEREGVLEHSDQLVARAADLDEALKAVSLTPAR